MTRLQEIRCQLSRVEGHNSLGEVERCQTYLQNVFEKVRLNALNLDSDYALSMELKAVSDTAGP